MVRKRKPIPFSAALRAARLHAGMTQRELEERLSLPPSAIAQYELGYREPRLSRFKALAGALGLTLDQLAGLKKLPA